MKRSVDGRRAQPGSRGIIVGAFIRCDDREVRHKSGIDALMHVVAAQWCMGYRRDDSGESSDFRRFIPPSGTVTADQFVDWVFLGSYPNPLESPALEQRARTDIRAAFVKHMGSETVDAAALHWPDEHMPLPDPEAFTRNLTQEELLGYREEFGEGSREWILAQNELRRRRRPRTLIVWAAGFTLLAAYWLWLRPLIWSEG